MKHYFLALVLGSVVLFTGCGNEQATTTITKQSVDLSLQSTGELLSSDTITLGPPMVRNGWQQKITYLVPEGNWVKKGQRILAFDKQAQMEFLRKAQNDLATEKQKLASQKLDSEQDQEQLKLDIAEAQMQLTKAQKKAEQDGDYAAQHDVKKLVIDLAIAKKELALSEFKRRTKQQQVEIEFNIIQAEVQRLEAEVEEFKAAIASLTIKAPRDGIAVYVQERDGSKPAQGDQIFVARKVIELPNLEKMQVKSTIPEQEVSRVSIGQKVKIHFDAIPNRVFNGKVSSLGQVVRVKSRQEPSMVFDAQISIDNPDRELMRPGMAARLSIVEDQLSDVVLLPESSIHYDGDDSLVFVKSVIGKSSKPVNILGRQNGKVIVTGDLADGDEVFL